MGKTILRRLNSDSSRLLYWKETWSDGDVGTACSMDITRSTCTALLSAHGERRFHHHTWRERGGYRGYRIPQDRFRANFGRGHWFRVHSAPVLVVGGYPRFQYGGFWFSVVDPWPEYWSRSWYETDDVYVDYVNDGYYMYNRRHPGVAIALNVSF